MLLAPEPIGKGGYSVALSHVNIETEKVDYINAHGTATKVNDHMEAQAIQRLFGKKNLARITVSSTKSMVGHCLAARSGVKPITTFDTEPYSANVAACVGDFKPAKFMSLMTYRRMSRISRMAVAASIEAVEDSGLCLEGMNRERVAVVMGTAYGSSSHVDGFYRRRCCRHGPLCNTRATHSQDYRSLHGKSWHSTGQHPTGECVG